MTQKTIKAAEPALTEWNNKTPPPMIGEWNASNGRNPAVRRWWNGTRWSLAYEPTDRETAIRRARRTFTSNSFSDIWWRGLAEKPADFEAPEPLGKL